MTEMTTQKKLEKIDEITAFFMPVIDKAVLNKVKLLSGWYTENNCNCLITHAFPSNHALLDAAIDDSLNKATQFFFKEDYFTVGGCTSNGGGYIQTIIDGWDNTQTELLPSDDRHEFGSINEGYEWSFALGQKLRQYYLDSGGIVQKEA
jgi:hypothetical protein